MLKHISSASFIEAITLITALYYIAVGRYSIATQSDSSKQTLCSVAWHLPYTSSPAQSAWVLPAKASRALPVART